jgi:hypothetical protein
VPPPEEWPAATATSADLLAEPEAREVAVPAVLRAPADAGVGDDVVVVVAAVLVRLVPGVLGAAEDPGDPGLYA